MKRLGQLNDVYQFPSGLIVKLAYIDNYNYGFQVIKSGQSIYKLGDPLQYDRQESIMLINQVLIYLGKYKNNLTRLLYV